MKFPKLPQFERSLKSIHSWLGLIVMPWIIVIGFTGFYLNHSSFVSGLLNGTSYNEAAFDDWPDPKTVDTIAALRLAQSVWPGAAFRLSPTDTYHGRLVWTLTSGSRQVIVDRQTGHYWVKTPKRRLTYSPAGEVLHSKTYWGSLFKTLHVNGWFDSNLGSWLADTTAVAMVVFGLTGIVLFVNPRLRRFRNRRARRRSTGQVGQLFRSG